MQQRGQSSPTLHPSLHKPAGRQESTAGCRQSAVWCWAGGGHQAVPLPVPCPSIPAALAHPPGRPGHPGSHQAPAAVPSASSHKSSARRASPAICLPGQAISLLGGTVRMHSAAKIGNFCLFSPRTLTPCVQRSQPAQPRCQGPFQNGTRPALTAQLGADPAISTRTRHLATDSAGAVPRCLPSALPSSCHP